MRRLSARPCAEVTVEAQRVDYFVACFVRAEPVFFAVVFPEEHNAPDDRALSLTELYDTRAWRLVPGRVEALST